MKQIPNNAVKQGDMELEKGGEIPEKLTQRCTELPKLIAVVELMYSRGRTVAVLNNVTHKAQQMISLFIKTLT